LFIKDNACKHTWCDHCKLRKTLKLSFNGEMLELNIEMCVLFGKSTPLQWGHRP